MSGAVDITAFCCGQGREFRIYVVVPDELEETIFTQPIHYFTRRTLLQDSASEFHEMCLRTRIALLLQEKRPRLITEGLNAIKIKLAAMDEDEAELERDALLEQRRALLEEQEELPKGAAGTAPDRIMSVCSLAQAQQSPAGPWCTRSVFVHSKVLMVDDIYLVVGSANVNDRSFMGDRDSELGVLLTDDSDTVESTMAGKSFRAGRTVREYRLRTFRGFLGRADGTPDDDIIDPIESGFDVWTSVAKENRRLLTAVFMHTPRDDIKSFGQWSDLREGYFAAFELVKTLAKEPEGLEGYQDALKLVGKEYVDPIGQLEDHTTLVAVFLRHLKKELEQAEEVERLEDAKASFASVQGLATELLQQLVTEPEQLRVVAAADPRTEPEPEPEAVPSPPPRPGFRGCLCEYPREFLGDQASRSALETFMETFPPGLDTAL